MDACVTQWYVITSYPATKIFSTFPPLSLFVFKNNARKFRETFFVGVRQCSGTWLILIFPAWTWRILNFPPSLTTGKDGGKVTVKRSSFVPRYGRTVRGTRSRQPRYVRTGDRVLFISSHLLLPWGGTYECCFWGSTASETCLEVEEDTVDSVPGSM